MRTWRLALLCACTGAAQHLPAFHMRYLDDAGHLDTAYDKRTAINIGPVRVTNFESGIRVTGRDDGGEPWGEDLPAIGGVGFTEVWQADFDRNGRQDLLFAAAFPANGRGCQEVTLVFLMLDERGRPVPWKIETQLPYGRRYPYVPAIFAAVDQNGRATLVVTDCVYSPPRFGVDRRITGIYQSENARWHLVRPVDMAPFIELAARNHLKHNPGDLLAPPDPSHWLDQGNASR